MNLLFGISLFLFAQGPAAASDLPTGATARLGSTHFRHNGHVGFVSLSPDGKQLFSYGYNDGMRVWEIATGKQLLFHSEKGPFVGTVLSPDGKLLAGSAEKSYALWDVAKQKVRFKLGDAKEGSNHPAVFSADSRRVAIRCGDSKMRVWDTETGKLLAEWQAGWLASTMSGDGKTVITDKQRGLLQFWDIETQKVTREIKLADHFYLVTGLTLSPNNELLAVSTGPHSENDGRTPATYFRMHDFATGKERYRIAMTKHFVSAVAFAPDGKTMAVAKHGSPHELEVREVADGKLLRTIPLPTGNCYSLSINGDGKMLAAALGEQLNVRLWKYPDLTPHLQSVGHTRPVTAVALSRDGKRAYSSSEDGTLITWDLKSEQPLDVAPLPIRYINTPWQVHDLFPTPDGKIIAAAVWHTDDHDPRQGTLYLRRLADGKEIRTIEKISGGVALSGKGDFLAHGKGSSIQVLDPLTGKDRIKLDVETRGVRRLAFSPVSPLLASIHNDGAVCLWDVAAGKQVRRWMLASEDKRPFFMARPPALTFSSDGRCLITSNSRWSTIIEVREVLTGETFQVVKLDKKISEAPVLLCVGRTLFFSGHRLPAELFDLVTGKVVGKPIDRRINGIGRSPDGKSLITAGNDGFVMLWKADILKAPPLDKADLTDKDFARLWGELDRSAATAFAAHWELARGDDAAVKFLGTKLRPVPAPDAKAVARYIADLSSPDFKTRDQASRDLEELGRTIEFDLRKALDARPPLEGKRRLEELLARFDRLPESLRARRAIAVLESIGTESARSVLQKLAEGASGSRVTVEAKESLQRISR